MWTIQFFLFAEARTLFFFCFVFCIQLHTCTSESFAIDHTFYRLMQKYSLASLIHKYTLTYGFETETLNNKTTKIIKKKKKNWTKTDRKKKQSAQLSCVWFVWCGNMIHMNTYIHTKHSCIIIRIRHSDVMVFVASVFYFCCCFFRCFQKGKKEKKWTRLTLFYDCIGALQPNISRNIVYIQYVFFSLLFCFLERKKK